MFVQRAGTRSEGRIGRLYATGQEVRSEPGATISTGPDGPEFVFLGDERPHLWSLSGWAIQGTDGPHLRVPSATTRHDGPTSSE